MSMTSLSPGVIFKETGLHRTSTPAGVHATPEQIQELFSREKYADDVDWPTDSPLAGSYDATNTSTKLVLINNRMPKVNKHLRGQGASSPDRAPPPDPDRHLSGVPQKNPQHHTTCNDSSSPRYVAKRPIPWVNNSQRPPWKPSDESAVDRTRHSDCQISSDPRWRSLEFSKRKKSGLQPRPKSTPICVQDNFYLQHPELRKGDKNYLWSVAKVYSSANMKVLKQIQYEKLLLRQEFLGFHSLDEYRKYQQYLASTRKMHFTGTDAPKTPRSKSASSQSSRRVKSARENNDSESKTVDDTSNTDDKTKNNNVNTSKNNEKSLNNDNNDGNNQTPRQHKKKSNHPEREENNFPKGLESRARAKSAHHRSRPRDTDENTAAKDRDKENMDLSESSSKSQDNGDRPQIKERSKSAKSRDSRSVSSRSRPGTGKSTRSDHVILPRSSPYLEDLTQTVASDWRPPPPSARSRKGSPVRGRRSASSAHSDAGSRPKSSVEKRPKSTSPVTDESNGKAEDRENGETETTDDGQKAEANTEPKKKRRYLVAEGTTRPKSRLGNRDPRPVENDKEDGNTAPVDTEENAENSEDKDGEDTNRSTSDNIQQQNVAEKKRRKHKKKLRIQETAAQNGGAPQEARGSDPVDEAETVSKKQPDEGKVQRESTASPTPNNNEIKTDKDEQYSEEAIESTKVEERNERHTDDIKQVSFSEKEKHVSSDSSEEEVRTKESESEASKPSSPVEMKREDSVKSPTLSPRATSPNTSSPTSPPLSPRVASPTSPPRDPRLASPSTSPPLSPTATSPTTSPPLSPTSVKDDTDSPTDEPQGTYADRSDTDDKAETDQAVQETERVETVTDKTEPNQTEITEKTDEQSTIKQSKLCYIANTEVYEGDEVETPEGRKMIGLAATIKSYQQAKEILDELKEKFTDSDSDRVPYACRYPTATSVSEHFDSNGVHGAGLELLRLLVDRKVRNVAIFVLIKKEEDGASYDNEVRHIVKCAEDVLVSLPKD